MTIPFVDMGRLHQPLRDELLGAFARVLDSGGYVQGNEVECFEHDFAAAYGVRHALAVSNGTSALHLALLAAGVGPGDEVITVSNTFIATVEAISMCGARPVFVDIDPVTMLMDPARLERSITPRTKAIIPVHLYGRVCDMRAILGIARQNGVKVIEDACQAHGAELDGIKAGAFADAGCLSFYPTKNLGTVGEGGMVLTNDDAVAERVASLRNHGQRERHNHVEPGFNYRMPELQAAALRTMLPHLQTWNAARVQVAAWYSEALAGSSVVRPAPAPAGGHVYHLYVVRTKERAELQKFLGSRGIGTAIHYPVPVHLQPAYRDCVPAHTSLSQTVDAVGEILSLPMHPSMTRSEADAVGHAIRDFGESRMAPLTATGGVQ